MAPDGLYPQRDDAQPNRQRSGLPAVPVPQRIGLGYDVHALVTGRKLIIGGVDIPYERGLDGHSDADVLAHALADAILGALRKGDIGELFPDNDPAFLDADSLVLLEEVGALATKCGWAVADCDCVIAAQAPKLSPYRQAMRTNLARTLHIDVESVGVKATTTEHLGFEGRGEGISAQAVVLLVSAEGCCPCSGEAASEI